MRTLPTANKILSTIKKTCQEVLMSAGEEDIIEKGAFNYSTSADLEMEMALIDSLSDLCPEAYFIGEEILKEEEPTDTRQEYNWVVDPIDGTTNFLHGLPFSVSVAFCKGYDAFSGVVYVPETDTAYIADKGDGAFVINKPDIKRKLTVDNSADKRPIIICGMPYDRTKAHRNFELMESLHKVSADIKRIGPASLDICRVADNQVAAYCELDLQQWDIMAAKLILEEAGGKSSKEGDIFVFSTASFHDSLVQIAKNHIP